MSIFTIYCHGSGGHRDKPDKEIVAYLGRNAVGKEYEDYLILDGVGGVPLTTGDQNPMAGSFNWADRSKAPMGFTPKEMGGSGSNLLKRMFVGGSGFVSQGITNAAGWGVESNARHAIVTIANLPQPPNIVNLIGWSRGAVTAMMIGCMLFDPTTTEGLFRGIEVNIFAIDPCAGRDQGLGQDSESRRSITENVKNFLGVLATGENRKAFQPQDLSRVHVHSPNSNVMFLPFPGKHSSPAQNNDERARPMFEITWSLGVQFLTKFGTPCPSPGPGKLVLSQEEYLEKYSEIVIWRQDYDKIKQKGLKQWVFGGGGFVDRQFATQHISDYVRYADYFVNEHHRAVFDRTLPTLSSWLFTPAGPQGGGMTSGQVYAELKRKENLLPYTMASLEKLAVTRDAKGQFVLPVPGSFTDHMALHDVQARGNLLRMGVLV